MHGPLNHIAGALIASLVILIPIWTSTIASGIQAAVSIFVLMAFGAVVAYYGITELLVPHADTSSETNSTVSSEILDD